MTGRAGGRSAPPSRSNGARRASAETGGRAGRLGSRRSASRYAPLLAPLLAAALYAGTLGGAFVYDDSQYILNNPWIRDLSHLGEIFGSHAAGFTTEYVAAYYRPLMHLFYLAVHVTFGPAPWAFHLLNILLHAGVSSMVLLAAREIVRRFAVDRRRGGRAAGFPGREDGGAGWADAQREDGARRLPLLAALLFAAHPVHTESVAWLAGVTDLSSSLFFLVSLWLYLRAWEDGRRDRLLSAAALFVACLCKEPAIVLPGVLLALEAFERPAGIAPAVWFRSLVARLAPAATAAAAYLALRAWALGGLRPEGRVGGDIPGGLLGVLNGVGLFGKYLGMLLLPVNLSVLHDWQPIASPVEPRALAALGVAGAFVGSAVVLRARRLVVVSLVLLAAPLLPALYIPALGDHVFAERYLYLPSVGFVILVAAAFEGVACLRWPGKRTTIAVFLALLALYGVGTVFRNRVWRDSETLWSDAARRSPRSAAAREFLGNALLARGKVDEAIAAYEAALSLDPNRPGARINLGTAYAGRGRVDEAIEQYERALRLGVGASRAHNNLGLALAEKGDLPRAMAHYEAALSLEPEYAEAVNNLGVALWRAGRIAEALQAFERASALDSGKSLYRENAARARSALSP